LQIIGNQEKKATNGKSSEVSSYIKACVLYLYNIQ
jgi:hypothetical protein